MNMYHWYNVQSSIAAYTWSKTRKSVKVVGRSIYCKVLLCFISLVLLTVIFDWRKTSARHVKEIPVKEQRLFRTGTQRGEAIPRVIHQIWLGFDRKEPPDAWKNATKRTMATNPDFAYRLWSKDDVVELLTSHYAWFLPTYHSYPYDVERADAARYFIILHHGGVYLDMDEISLVPISDIIASNRLERYQCMLPAGTPNGITNYVIMCKGRSSFMRHLTSELVKSKGWYGIPYATVMWSTGPRFISAVYENYANKESIFVMDASEVTRNFECLFGQSWFSIDGVLIHIVVYPFVRLGLSWTYLFVFVTVILLYTGMCFVRQKSNSKGEHSRRFLSLRRMTSDTASMNVVSTC